MFFISFLTEFGINFVGKRVQTIEDFFSRDEVCLTFLERVHLFIERGHIIISDKVLHLFLEFFKSILQYKSTYLFIDIFYLNLLGFVFQSVLHELKFKSRCMEILRE